MTTVFRPLYLSFLQQPIHSAIHHFYHAFHFHGEEQAAEYAYGNARVYGYEVYLFAVRFLQGLYHFLFVFGQIGEELLLYAVLEILFQMLFLNPPQRFQHVFCTSDELCPVAADEFVASG